MKNKTTLYVGIFCTCIALGLSTFGMQEGDQREPRPQLTKSGQKKKNKFDKYMNAKNEGSPQKGLIQKKEPKLRGQKTGVDRFLQTGVNLKKLHEDDS